MTRFVGILGWPLDHTLSPVIHNAALTHLGLDCVYIPFPTPPEALRDAVVGLGALGAIGANVTMPHKETVVDLLDEVSAEASEVGAVNTIARRGERFVGHNTDVSGFADFVKEDTGYNILGKRALVVGAGGAARAIVRALIGLRAADIGIAARRADVAARVARLTPCARVVPWDDGPRGATDADVVVNTTPVGMAGEDALPGARFRSGQLVVDLIYEPPGTRLLQRARAAGADARGGLGMLVHQAAATFEIWTGAEAPLEVMSSTAVRALAGHS